MTVTVAGPAAALAASPSAVDASALPGGSAVRQTLAVTNASGAAHFAVYTTIVNGSGWMSVSPASGDTPANLTVVLDPAGLSPSTYIGSIQLMPTSPAGSPISIPVTFHVLPPASLAAAPAALSFVVAPGQPPAAAQTLKIASAGFNAAGRHSLGESGRTPGWDLSGFDRRRLRDPGANAGDHSGDAHGRPIGALDRPGPECGQLSGKRGFSR